MGFADDVAAWAKQAERGMEQAFGRAVDLLAEEINTPRPAGPLPHKDGNLMRSLRASTSPIPMGEPGEDYTAEDVGLVTATLTADDQVFLGWRANYAHRQNYGFVGTDAAGRQYDQAGAHFIEHGVAQWDQIKERAWKEIFGG